MATVRYTAVPADSGDGDALEEGVVELVERSAGVPGQAGMMLNKESAVIHTAPFWGSCRCACVMMCWLANVVCYVDRINISISIISMSEELGWTESQQGYVLSAFFYGYMLTQIIGGKLAQRYGGSIILQISVFIWSLFTMLTPIAARSSLGFLYFARVGMGFGEGATLPSIHASLSRWIPIQERTRAVAFVTSGQLMGTVVALASSPAVAKSWAAVFYVFGALGFVWILLARRFFVSFPEQHPSITTQELAFIVKNRDEASNKDADKLHPSPSPSREKGRQMHWTTWSLCGLCCSDTTTAARPLPPWYALVVQPPVLAAMIALLAHNWGWYVMLGWMPKYLKHLGADTAIVGLYALLPYLLMFIADLVWGWYLDKWIARGMPVVGARKLSQTFAMGTPILALTVLATLPNEPSMGVAILLLTMATTMSSCTHSGVWANVIDIAPSHAGFLLGIVNSFATLSGWILDGTGSWNMVFAVAVAVYVCGLLVYLIWGQARVLYT